MSRQYLIPEDFYQYLLANSLRESKIAQALRQETQQLSQANMQISPEQGQFLSFLVKLIGAKKALEIGTFTGYSALMVSEALKPEGRLICCDVNQEWTDIAKRYWEKAGVQQKIKLYLAPASETLEKLLEAGEAASFDFCFIDADKQNYDVYYEQALQLIRPGGLIAIDNAFMHGAVLAPTQNQGAMVIHQLNQKLHQDDRVEVSFIPMADGLYLVRKKV